MKKIFYAPVLFLAMVMALTAVTACNDGETYADKKKKEKNSISKFLAENEFVGPIKVISENQFYAQDSTTNVENNEFVLFNDDGVYMQIVKKGGGKSFVEMAKETPDSTVNKVVLCRYMEYNIQTGDTVSFNNVSYFVTLVDKMLVNYNHRGRSYSSSFIEGVFPSIHKTKAVPAGWLKPLAHIRMSRSTDDVASVRLIVPHSSGSSEASQYVYPFYYEISYQLGK